MCSLIKSDNFFKHVLDSLISFRAAEVDAYFEEMNNGEPQWGGWDDAPYQFSEYHRFFVHLLGLVWFFMQKNWVFWPISVA